MQCNVKKTFLLMINFEVSNISWVMTNGYHIKLPAAMKSSFLIVFISTPRPLPPFRSIWKSQRMQFNSNIEIFSNQKKLKWTESWQGFANKTMDICFNCHNKSNIKLSSISIKKKCFTYFFLADSTDCNYLLESSRHSFLSTRDIQTRCSYSIITTSLQV